MQRRDIKMTDVMQVAIIGAGVSGLTALKSCLEEGLEPVCFERCEEIGGMWYADDNMYPSSSPKPYPSLVTNTSKMMSCFSDFPFSKDTTTFMTPKMIHDYLLSYVDQFKLRKYIQFKTEVHKVSKARDFDETGNWEVAIHDSNGKSRVEVFNAVVICSGYFKKPRYPDIEGMGSFQGKIEHAINFKTGEAYRDKNVVVVGNSFSAGDIAVAAAEYANQVYVSVGRGCVVLRRFDDNGWPWDMQVFRRVYSSSWTVVYLLKIVRKITSIALNHDAVGIHSEKPFPFCPFMLNDDVGSRIMTGKVKVVGTVVRMAEKSVHIDDGTVVDDVDVVVFATGYDRHLPFLDNSLVDSAQAINEQKNEWYKLIFPVHLQHPTLAMVGMATGEGSNLPIYEMQSRLAARVLCGKHKLPAKNTMLKDIDRWNSYFKFKFSYYKHQVPYLPYIEELAAELGVKPTFCRLFWWKPRLAYLCIFGPASPLQYRLIGPHSNAEAINHCSAIYENTFSGVRHRRVPPRKPITLCPSFITILIPVAFTIAAYYVWKTYFL
ncbi:dimethylaniline monooxygenase [N-oxide-forming] 2-like [Gigantopelta aegis]|uniref:dimethylaniline monooxygenase [N-oxide-forming] 2-like n=1 Tax=Gigantopelta aegis TaxID=1735272 RepID=UPI001B88B4B9|nr:dimethylaniline monooxygenase [N-oxide-forming] 2-like [Gigantopelta aegis]